MEAKFLDGKLVGALHLQEQINDRENVDICSMTYKRLQRFRLTQIYAELDDVRIK